MDQISFCYLKESTRRNLKNSKNHSQIMHSSTTRLLREEAVVTLYRKTAGVLFYSPALFLTLNAVSVNRIQSKVM